MFVECSYDSGVWGGVSGAALAERVVQLACAAHQINLELSKAAAAFAETDEYDEQGFDSPIAWIKANCHMSGGPPVIASASVSSWSGSGRAGRRWAWVRLASRTLP